MNMPWNKAWYVLQRHKYHVNHVAIYNSSNIFWLRLNLAPILTPSGDSDSPPKKVGQSGDRSGGLTTATIFAFFGHPVGENFAEYLTSVTGFFFKGNWQMIQMWPAICMPAIIKIDGTWKFDASPFDSCGTVYQNHPPFAFQNWRTLRSCKSGVSRRQFRHFPIRNDGCRSEGDRPAESFLTQNSYGFVTGKTCDKLGMKQARWGWIANIVITVAANSTRNLNIMGHKLVNVCKTQKRRHSIFRPDSCHDKSCPGLKVPL